MAIIKCPHCKKETISTSDKCINCGKEISQYDEQSPVKNDKKIYIAIICVLLLLIISLIVIFVIVPAIKNNSSKATSVQIENTEITITSPLVTKSESIFTTTTILMTTTFQPTTTISTTTTTVTITIPEPTNMITEPIIQTPTDPWFVNRENSPLRYVCWGDSIDVVKEIENYQGTNIITEDGGTLIYETSINGSPVYLGYSFDGEYGLFKASYYTDDLNEGASAISRYDDFKILLMNIYGEPNIDEEKILNKDLYNLCDNKGQALELGYMGYICEWQLSNTSITLTAGTINYDTFVSISFTNPDHPDRLTIY